MSNPRNSHQFFDRMKSGSSVMSSTVVDKQVRIPRRVMREQVVERVVVVPEKIMVEEDVEEIENIQVKTIEVQVPVYQERIVEVPEVEYVEKIVEVPQVQIVEKINHIPVRRVEEIIREVPIHQVREVIVEVPQVEYVEIPVEKIVEVPQIEEKIVYKDVLVPQYVDRPYPVEVLVEQKYDVHRKVPVPVESVTAYKFEIPTLRPAYSKKTLSIFVPRFVEVPVPAEFMDADAHRTAMHLRDQIHLLAQQEAPSLCEIEKITNFAKNINFQGHISYTQYQMHIENAWRKQDLNFITSDHHMSPRL